MVVVQGFPIPIVVTKTGLKTPNGQEELLTEYFCDHPDCPNVATQGETEGLKRPGDIVSISARRLVPTRKIRELSSRRSHPPVHSVLSGHFPVPGP